MFNFYGNNGNNSGFIVPFIGSENNTNVKNAHDTYDVFVNHDYVGRKTLLGQNEDLRDIDDHLKNHGFKNFRSSVEGNQVNIECDNLEDASRIKNDLEVYLDIR